MCRTPTLAVSDVPVSGAILMMAYCAAAALKRYQRSSSLGFNLPVTTLLIAPLAKWMGVSLVLAIALWAPTLINAALNNSVFSARVLDKVVLLLIDNIITSLLNYILSRSEERRVGTECIYR